MPEETPEAPAEEKPEEPIPTPIPMMGGLSEVASYIMDFCRTSLENCVGFTTGLFPMLMKACGSITKPKEKE